MNKRMIDAEALLEQIQIEKNNCPFGDLNSKRGWGVALLNIEQHISLLTTPAHETQESIFDTEGWCWNMSLMPKNTVVACFFPDRSPPKGFLAIGEVKSIYSNCIDPKNTTAKAWRPLPTGGNHE